MQLYGRGIRRRLPPMLGKPERVRMAYALLLALPGTPVLWYGEEIGMGDDLTQPERSSVRTPMQWSASANGGFSEADPACLPRPAISGGPYGYEKVNVEAQRCDPNAFLAWFEHLLRVRKEHRAFGRGEWRLVDTRHESVFAHACTWNDDTVAAVFNLGGQKATVQLDLSPWPEHEALNILDPGCERWAIDGDHEMTLEPYGFRWLRLSKA